MSSPLQHSSLDTFLRIYEQILDRMNEGVHVIDANGTTIVYNQKMTELESMTIQDVLHKPLSEVFAFPDGQESTLLTCLHTGKSIRNTRQTYFNDKQKEITTINNTYPIMENGKIVGAMEIADDITKMERLIRENLLEKNGSRYTFDQIIGSSGAILDVIESAKRVARTSSSVLVVGETGAGKELFVQSIHNASLRASGPLISQNCAALPDSLIEGLLFGTARGAFTGAIERPGLFEQAEKGTLFLDEINSLSMPLQAKLLRALQEKSIRRIGDTKDRSIDVRIIAAINEDPVEAIAHSHLRKDLYYRLGVVTLFIPPLRDRKEDIPLLANHFVEKYNQLFQMEVRGLSDEVIKFFNEHDWPGNVRELQHLIEGAMNLMIDETIIGYEHLPLHFLRRTPAAAIIAEHEKQPFLPFPEEGKPLKETMLEFETSYIHHVVDKYNGNISRAAKELQISRQSLQYRLRKLGIRG
ncbi:sigma 54-interacting transcriptional regulator [Brevibacillus centrosporus]|nr:sigma 54-interacting transcriptional regulator [Brevibacillus centrosporus]MED4908642.1 sigma 54-interacting transcriptional regulator [Brevibacillus centrosporus]RNB69709.1 PAS domain S-box protein [Brevibacillus centrosporus]